MILGEFDEIALRACISSLEDEAALAAAHCPTVSAFGNRFEVIPREDGSHRISVHLDSHRHVSSHEKFAAQQIADRIAVKVTRLQRLIAEAVPALGAPAPRMKLLGMHQDGESKIFYEFQEQGLRQPLRLDDAMDWFRQLARHLAGVPSGSRRFLIGGMITLTAHDAAAALRLYAALCHPSLFDPQSNMSARSPAVSVAELQDGEALMSSLLQPYRPIS